jgi:hypothetical protein
MPLITAARDDKKFYRRSDKISSFENYVANYVADYVILCPSAVYYRIHVSISLTSNSVGRVNSADPADCQTSVKVLKGTLRDG